MGGIKRKNRDKGKLSFPTVKVRKENDPKPLPPSKTGPQRAKSKSPTPSDESTWDSASNISNSTNSSTSSAQVTIPNPNQTTVVNHTPRTPPIILTSSFWREKAPTIFSNLIITPETVKAKVLSDGNVSVQTNLPETFRLIQKQLSENHVPFHTFNFPEDRTLKIVFLGIPTDITEAEIEADRENRGFDINLVKRFGPISKPIPICLVILKKTTMATEIYSLYPSRSNHLINSVPHNDSCANVLVMVRATAIIPFVA